MYKLEFLPIAKKDMDGIIYYVSNDLKNETAAVNISKCFIEGIKHILNFPYSSSEYKATSKLKNTYRSINIKNFLMFYTINEQDKMITIVRVLHQKMDINNILN